MSQQLINRSPDLKRLRDEGYDVEVRSNYLLVKNVPYVNSKAEVKIGTLVSELSLAGDITVPPNTHVLYFIGEYPCEKDGSEIFQIKHNSQDTNLAADLVVNHSFSSKPNGGYKDYYDKMCTYISIISNPAISLNTNLSARVFPAVEADEEGLAFNYVDTASSRAGIGVAMDKLKLERIAIVGVGGTGSYVLDLVAKTPVREIHLFDGDVFSQHNAFRAPGAPTIEELRQSQLKVNYFKGIYSKMHRGIVAHECPIIETNIEQLRGMDFVFLCLDSGDNKKLLLEKLEEWHIPFIDVGLGVELVDCSLGGIIRVTTSTDHKREHIKEKNRIPLSETGNDEYSRNIQIADLNALCASLAIVKWKKLFGFYRDLEKEHHSTYTIDGNTLINEDQL